MGNILNIIKSRLSMKRIGKTFQNSPGWTVICEYRDVFNKHWLASYPFYVWSYRIEKKDIEKRRVIGEPCNYDSVGNCLVCVSGSFWSDGCGIRYKNKNIREATEEKGICPKCETR
jgi:hypothetical protein